MKEYRGYKYTLVTDEDEAAAIAKLTWAPKA